MYIKKVIKKYSKILIAFIIGIFLASLIGCKITKITPEPVNTEFLRAEYVKSLLNNLNTKQWAGDAENSLSGNEKFYLTLEETAKRIYPENNYYEIKDFNNRQAEGYIKHSNIDYRQIFTKNNE